MPGDWCQAVVHSGHMSGLAKSCIAPTCQWTVAELVCMVNPSERSYGKQAVSVVAQHVVGLLHC